MGVLASCSDTARPSTIAGVAFDSTAITMVTGDTLTAPARATDARGGTIQFVLFTYTSADTTIARVDGSGRIVAVAPGRTSISASIEGHAGQLAVTVVLPTVRSVAFAPDTASAMVDQTTTLVATVTDVRNKVVKYPLRYASSDTNVAVVNANGVVTATGPGVATLTAIADTARASLAFTALPQFRKISAGEYHTCGISYAGPTYCWGMIAIGTLDAPVCPEISAKCARTPMRVSGGLRFVDIAAGGQHSCGVDATGAAYCWGRNGYGQLGNASVSDEDVPDIVHGGLTFLSIATGRFHSCGITTVGETYCWGLDDKGQIGAGQVVSDACQNQPCAMQPARVAGGLPFVELKLSEYASCGRTSDGAIYCWGAGVGGTDTVQCAGGSGSPCTRTPLLQVGGAQFAHFEMGWCGQLAAGALQCWGSNDFGQYGDGTTNWSATPVSAAGGMTFTSLTSARTTVCGIASSAAFCWGQNLFGNVGDGSDAATVLTPSAVAGSVSFDALWSGSSATTVCGMSTSGRTYCWGDGRFGQLGNGLLTSSNVPTRIGALP